MSNQILGEFDSQQDYKDYEFGTITEAKSNGIYIIRTTSGLDLTIQDQGTYYEVDDLVVLALAEGDTNSAFIIKKSSKAFPISENFVVANDLN